MGEFQASDYCRKKYGLPSLEDENPLSYGNFLLEYNRQQYAKEFDGHPSVGAISQADSDFIFRVQELKETIENTDPYVPGYVRRFAYLELGELTNENFNSWLIPGGKFDATMEALGSVSGVRGLNPKTTPFEIVITSPGSKRVTRKVVILQGTHPNSPARPLFNKHGQIDKVRRQVFLPKKSQMPRLGHPRDLGLLERNGTCLSTDLPAIKNAIATVRSKHGLNCHLSVNDLSSILPQGDIRDYSGTQVTHVVYCYRGRIIDPTARQYVVPSKSAVWTDHQLTKEGLIDAVDSGVFTPRQHRDFMIRLNDRFPGQVSVD